MPRYTIWATQWGVTQESAIANCESNPQAIADALAEKTLSQVSPDGTRRNVRKYTKIRIQDNQETVIVYESSEKIDGE